MKTKTCTRCGLDRPCRKYQIDTSYGALQNDYFCRECIRDIAQNPDLTIIDDKGEIIYD